MSAICVHAYEWRKNTRNSLKEKIVQNAVLIRLCLIEIRTKMGKNGDFPLPQLLYVGQKLSE